MKVQEAPGEHTEDARALLTGEMETKQSKKNYSGKSDWKRRSERRV